MLILTRRVSEAICIGGTQVRIGIKAPRDVTVDREEIAQRKVLGLAKGGKCFTTF